MKSKNSRKDKIKNLFQNFDFWATNSEEGGWNISSTDEGSQKMLETERRANKNTNRYRCAR
jgi:hypothetical protein